VLEVPCIITGIGNNQKRQ